MSRCVFERIWESVGIGTWHGIFWKKKKEKCQCAVFRVLKQRCTRILRFGTAKLVRLLSARSNERCT